MTYEQQNVAITWACACLAVLGAYGVLLASWVLFTRAQNELLHQDAAICDGPAVSPYEQGRQAYRHGVERSDNPYATFSAPASQWDEGWKAEMYALRFSGSVK